MIVSNIRSNILRLGIPNAVVGLGIMFIIVLHIVIIFAMSAGKNATESVQITYQLALIIAGLIGLPLAVWRSWTAHRQAATGMEQLKGLQRQIALAEAGADADRLQKGAEMLQAEGRAVRIAGVAILREIALNVNHRYAQEAFSVLASFVRSTSEAEDALERKTPEDLLEAFIAVAASRVLHNGEIGRVALRGVGISGVKIETAAYVQCLFQDCSFRNSLINDDCYATFDNCKFYGNDIVFDQFTLTDFTECSFNGSTFYGQLHTANFKKCTFARLKADKDFSAVGETAPIMKAMQAVSAF